MESKCDLILLTWNNLEILKRCVESILRCTHLASRLIIVDNGSTQQGMKEYLSSLKGAEDVRIEILTNETNYGFARGMNKGIRASSAPYLCLLNNDILVTDGWLEEMIKIAEDNPQVGVVNPSSNNFGLRFGRDTTLEEFAKALKTQTGKWVEMDSGIGFCMLVKREVVDKIGCLSEDYGPAFFEDRDYSRRVRGVGYKCVMAKGCYVYHMQGQSVKLLKEKDKLFDRNAELFHKRWGRPERIAYVLAGGDAAYIADAAERIEGEVRANNRVWIFQRDGGGRLKLREHLDVMLSVLPARFFKLNAFWKIIKKKKRFDRLYVDDDRLRNILLLFKRLHKANVMR